MPSHISACHFGSDGRCIWCGLTSQEQKHPHQQDQLPPPITLGKPHQASTTYIPFSNWGRNNVRRTWMELVGEINQEEELKDVLEALTFERREPDRILGAGRKANDGPFPIIRSGHL